MRLMLTVLEFLRSKRLDALVNWKKEDKTNAFSFIHWHKACSQCLFGVSVPMT